MLGIKFEIMQPRIRKKEACQNISLEKIFIASSSFPFTKNACIQEKRDILKD